MNEKQQGAHNPLHPTVGRVVLFFQRSLQDKNATPPEQAAIITRVWGPDMVNLTVFGNTDMDKPAQNETSVRLFNPGEGQASGEYRWCEWMPYQVGQAARTSLAEDRLEARITALEKHFGPPA